MAGKGEFSIDPEVLRVASQRMQSCADDFARSVQTLSSHVTGSGSPWGSDETGSMFGAAYTEASQLGLKALAHLVDQLGGVAEALDKIGSTVQAVDEGESNTFAQSRGGGLS
jgi:uncharacterized protein YukE